AEAINRVKVPSSFLLGETFVPEKTRQEIGYSEPRAAEADDCDPLLLKRNAGYVDGRQYRCRSNCRSSLNVVVEGAQLVAVAVEESRGISSSKVLPLQENVWPALFDRLHKRIHECIVFLAANAMVSPANVNGALQAFFVIGSHVEQDRQAILRMDAAQRRVQGHLANGNPHASGALIAEPKDS